MFYKNIRFVYFFVYCYVVVNSFTHYSTFLHPFTLGLMSHKVSCHIRYYVTLGIMSYQVLCHIMSYVALGIMLLGQMSLCLMRLCYQCTPESAPKDHHYCSQQTDTHRNHKDKYPQHRTVFHVKNDQMTSLDDQMVEYLFSIMSSKPITIRWISVRLKNHVQHRIADNFLRILK